jgi:hypothetical protein
LIPERSSLEIEFALEILMYKLTGINQILAELIQETQNRIHSIRNKEALLLRRWKDSVVIIKKKKELTKVNILNVALMECMGAVHELFTGVDKIMETLTNCEIKFLCIG